MESKWWCWNLPLACVPGLLSAAVCESLRPALDRIMKEINAKMSSEIKEDEIGNSKVVLFLE